MQREGEGMAPPSASRSIMNSSQRCLSGMEALKEDGTSATTIIVWNQPAHLHESRVAASAITSASLLAAVPSAHPPSPLCMRHHDRLPGGGRSRKDEKESRKPCQDPNLKLEGSRGSPRPQKALALLCLSFSPDPPFPPHHLSSPCPFQHPSLS